MISICNKKAVISIIIIFSLLFIGGCSNTTKPSSDNTNSTISKNQASSDNKINNSQNSSTSGQQQDNSQQTILENIKNLAQQGKIINCDFQVKNTNIGDVQNKWGNADKSDWIPEAKGQYDTYSKYNVAFGYNKGCQIFEVRSFDGRLSEISLSMVKKVFGTPEHDVKFNNEEIIGYTLGKEFKILFVFPQTANESNDPILKHYSVFYPAGTINTMANDLGRQW